MLQLEKGLDYSDKFGDGVSRACKKSKYGRHQLKPVYIARDRLPTKGYAQAGTHAWVSDTGTKSEWGTKSK